MNENQAVNLIRFLNRGGSHGYYWLLPPAEPGQSKPRGETIWFPADSPCDFPDGSYNLYFGIHPVRAIPQRMRDDRPISPRFTRAKLEDIAAVNCLFAEFDAKHFGGGKQEARKAAEGVKLPPNVLIDSGGGYHAYWLLHRPYTISNKAEMEYYRLLQYRWVEYVHSDPDSKDLCRVLRVPGTYNLKYDPPREVELLYADFDIAYELADLERLLPQSQPSGPEEKPAPTPAIYYDGPRDPARRWLEEALSRVKGGDATNGRNHVGYWLAQQLIWDGVSPIEQERVMIEYANKVRYSHKDGQEYNESEALASLKSARNLPKRDPARGRGNGNMMPRNGNGKLAAAVAAPAVKATVAMPAPALAVEPELPEAPEPEDLEEPPSPIEEETPTEKAADESANPPDKRIENSLRFAPADHDGHAQCVRQLYPNKFCWVEKWGWLWYTGKFWSRDGAEGAVTRAIVQTLKRRREAGRDMGENGKALVQASKGNNNNLKGVKEVLAAYTEAFTDDFDKWPDMLNVQNGVLNLRNGQLTPHNPKQRFTYVLPIAYDPKADYSEWVKQLLEAVDQREIVEYLQVAIGYSLTGHTYEEIMFYLFGPPRSGKGTFTEVILSMMGKPLAVEADMSTFTSARNGDTSNFDLAPLKPCRFVAASESSKNTPLNPEKIKAMTGRNQVRCSFKHKTHFEYQPMFKIWLSSNNPVNLDVEDDAAWGRVRVINFPHSHLGEEDKTRKVRLSTPAMLRGVLRWAVEGAQLWFTYWGQKTGLPIPEPIREATTQQRQSQDFVSHCLEERFVEEPDQAYWISTADAYQVYKSWCEDNGQPPKYHNQFSQALARRGHPIVIVKSNGKTVRKVSRLKLI